MGDTDGIDLQTSRTTKFTWQERKFLLTLVNKHYDVIHSKRADPKSTKQKYEAWGSISEEFSQSNTLPKRTTVQLKRCWENMRSQARKGDPSARRLVRWAEEQYRLSVNKTGEDAGKEKETNHVSDLVVEQDSESSVDDTGSCDDLKNMSGKLEESLQQLEDSLNAKNNHTTSILNDTIEQLARVQLVKLEKCQKERLFNLKVQIMKAKEKREKELHQLAVQEMHLKVENERRRAEIFEKELGKEEKKTIAKAKKVPKAAAVQQESADNENKRKAGEGAASPGCSRNQLQGKLEKELGREDKKESTEIVVT